MKIDRENKVIWCSEQLIEWKNSFQDMDNPVVYMMHLLSRAGFGWGLTDADENEVDFEFWDKTKKKNLMLAILEGYEFKLNKKINY